jgi:hypothetical protein
MPSLLQFEEIRRKMLTKEAKANVQGDFNNEVKVVFEVKKRF